jgi:hypothetical protein
MRLRQICPNFRAGIRAGSDREIGLDPAEVIRMSSIESSRRSDSMVSILARTTFSNPPSPFAGLSAGTPANDHVSSQVNGLNWYLTQCRRASRGGGRAGHRRAPARTARPSQLYAAAPGRAAPPAGRATQLHLMRMAVHQGPADHGPAGGSADRRAALGPRGHWMSIPLAVRLGRPGSAARSSDCLTALPI